MPCRGENHTPLCDLPTEWAGYKFRQCPWLEMREPAWQLVVMELNAAEVAPLTGWPDQYSAFMFDGMSMAKSAINQAQLDSLKKR